MFNLGPIIPDKFESLGQVLNEVRESESTCTGGPGGSGGPPGGGGGGWVHRGGSDALLSMDIFRKVWSVVEIEAREGKGVDEAVGSALPPSSEGLFSHWPRCGARGLGKSSVSSWTIRRHTKP